MGNCPTEISVSGTRPLPDSWQGMGEAGKSEPNPTGSQRAMSQKMLSIEVRQSGHREDTGVE